MRIETKYVGGEVTEFKTVRNAQGIEVGQASGYIAAWSIDKGSPYQLPDKFHPGCFKSEIERYQKTGAMPKMKLEHKTTIGVFLPETLKEDSHGLWGTGEINLETEKGRETYSLVRQKALSDFSIGFGVHPNDYQIKGSTRHIYDVKRFKEGSVVDDPMNPDAIITAVKSLVPFQDYRIAPKDTPWDQFEAIQRIRSFTNSANGPANEYKTAFLWCDADHSNEFDSHQMPIADVIDGQITIVPRAVFAAANSLKSSSIPEEDKFAVQQVLERYYSKMGMSDPFQSDLYYNLEDVKNATTRQVERMLNECGAFSTKASRFLASQLQRSDDNISDRVIEGLDKIRLELSLGHGK